MSFEEQIRLNCGRLPFDRIKIYQFRRLELASIGRGVFFVFATWSGSAVVSFRLFCEALAQTCTATVAIFVINADDFNIAAFKKTFGELPQGEGEAFWIKNGRVICVDHGYTDKTKDVLQLRLSLMNSPKCGPNKN